MDISLVEFRRLRRTGVFKGSLYNILSLAVVSVTIIDKSHLIDKLVLNRSAPFSGDIFFFFR